MQREWTGGGTMDEGSRPPQDQAGTEPTPWVELRIHGVSGTPPEHLLSAPHVVQVAGDAGRRIYRRADCVGEPVDADPDGRLLEGYHWGNLTSGSWRQGLWLLLIPFGLINAAQFMLPHPPARDAVKGSDRDGWRRWPRTFLVALHIVCGAMLRMVALGMTLVLTLTLTFIAVGLVGLQKASEAPLAPWLQDGGAAGLALAAAAGAVFLLYWAGGRTHRFTVTHQEVGAEFASGLARWPFFRGDPSAPDLRRLHLGAGIALTTLPGALTLSAEDGGGAPAWIVALATVVLGLIALLALLVGDPSESASIDLAAGTAAATFKQGIRATVKVGNWPLLFIATALVVWEVVLLSSGGALEGVAGLARVDEIAVVLLAFTTVSMCILGAANLLLALGTRDICPPDASRYFGRYAGGLAAAFVSTVGVFVGLGFSGAFAYSAAKALSVPTDQFPQILERIAYSWGLTAILMAGIAAVLSAFWLGHAAFGFPSRPQSWWHRARLRSTYRSRANIDFATADPHASRVDAELEGRIASSMWLARVKRSLTWIVVVFAVAGIAMSAVSGMEMLDACTRGTDQGLFDRADCTPESEQGGAFGWASEARGGDAEFLIGLGVATLLLLAVGLVSVGRGAIRHQSKRRGANVLWDVISFWPHAAHPFAPPPYSQLAVIHFRDRIRWHLYDGDPPSLVGDAKPDETRLPTRRVVVSAHSQGSLITMAALLWIPERERDWIGLVTFGSQLQVAFPRAFPHYVNYALIDDVHEALGHRWVNLYRETDPIAGPVLSWRHWTTGPTSKERFDARDRDRKEVAAATAPDAVPPRPPHPYASSSFYSGGVRSPDRECVGGVRICGDDWRLLDPIPYDLDAQTGPVWQIRGHSDYFADPHYPYAVKAVGGGHSLLSGELHECLQPVPPSAGQDAP